MGTVMPHKDISGYIKTTDYQQELSKLFLYTLGQGGRKLILKDENEEVIAEINTNVFWDEDNSRLIFLNKEISTFFEVMDQEYKNAQKEGFLGTKQEYFEARDYT